MNGEYDIRAAILGGLRGDTALVARVNRVYDEVPVKSTPPMIVVGQSIGDDWGTKDKAGRELRIPITIEDDLETSARISAIMPMINAVVEGMPRSISGWRTGSLRLMRSRLLRMNNGRWNGVMDYRIRILAEG